MEILKKQESTNVSDPERIASMIGGAALAAYGLRKQDRQGLGLAALGGALLFRGYTGHSFVYQLLGVNTAQVRHPAGTAQRVSVPYELGLRVDHSVHVRKPLEEVYAFWRQLENLPRFMDHLVCVKVLDARRSHWVAKGPAGIEVEWDAEIINEIPNELLGWRSLEGSEVDNAGSVRFEPQPGGGTMIHVSMQYNPPAGALGAAIASLFGQNPKKQIKEDLQRFKELMETGSITTKGRSSNEPERNVEAGAKKMWDRDAVNYASEESFPASDPPGWTPAAI